MGPPPPPPPRATITRASWLRARLGATGLSHTVGAPDPHRPCPSRSRRRLAEEIEVKLDLQALRELQPLEELRQRLRSSDF